MGRAERWEEAEIATAQTRLRDGAAALAGRQWGVRPSVGRRGLPELRAELAWRLDRFNKFLLGASPVIRVTAGIGREACRALGLSRVACLHADYCARCAKGGAGYGLEVALLREVREPFESSPWIEACARSGRPCFTANARNGPAIPLEHVERFGIGPLLCVPVVCSKGPLAILLLDRRGEPFGVDDELMAAAASVGASLGVALEAARTYAGREDEGGAVPALSSRQLQVLTLLNRGLSNKEMAAATGLSVFTVRDHVSSLLRCLDVDSRSAAVARGWELRLLGVDGAR